MNSPKLYCQLESRRELDGSVRVVVSMKRVVGRVVNSKAGARIDRSGEGVGTLMLAVVFVEL